MNTPKFDDDDDDGRYDGQHPRCREDTPEHSNPKEKHTKPTDFPAHSKPPEVGTCPRCLHGRLVILFGQRKYCNKCKYVE